MATQTKGSAETGEAVKRTSRRSVLEGGICLFEGGTDVKGNGELLQGFGRFLLFDKRKNLLS